MSSGGKVKARRHSLPSMASSPAVQPQEQVLASSDSINSARTDTSDAATSRKRPLNQAEVNSAPKRPAVSIISSEVHEPVSKEQLQVSEHTLCCLPGGT